MSEDRANYEPAQPASTQAAEYLVVTMGYSARVASFPTIDEAVARAQAEAAFDGGRRIIARVIGDVTAGPRPVVANVHGKR